MVSAKLRMEVQHEIFDRSRNEYRDLELFSIQFNLEQFVKYGKIPRSISINKLHSKFGTTKEVVKYLLHRRAQLLEGVK